MTHTATMRSSQRQKPHRRVSYVPPERTRHEAVTFVVATFTVLGAVVAVGAMLLALSLSS
jgi:nitrate reductase NapE component